MISFDEKIGPRCFEAYKKLRLKKSNTDGYIILSMGYAQCPFRDFESSHRIVVSSDEEYIQLILKQYNSNFVTYDLSPGIYTIEGIADVVYTMGDHEGSLQIAYDDITMKTKLSFKHFVGIFAR